MDTQAHGVTFYPPGTPLAFGDNAVFLNELVRDFAEGHFLWLLLFRPLWGLQEAHAGVAA